MTKSYSPSTRGFYDTDLHEVVPADGIELSETEYAALLIAIGTGKVVSVEDGKVVLSDPVAPSLTEGSVDEIARTLIEDAYGTEAQAASVSRYLSTLAARKAAGAATEAQEAALTTLIAAADWEEAVWACAAEIKASGDYADAEADGAFPAPPAGLAAIVAQF